jgi:ABC-type phosphate transport system substrate-binding protein
MTRHALCLMVVGTLLVGFSAGSQTAVRAAAKPLVVIVSATTPIRDISTAQLRRAFQGEPTDYAAGKRLIPINQPLDSAARVQFDRVLLGLRASEVGPFWIDRRIRDQSGPPKSAPSAEFALRIVMSLTGAISYVEADQLNDKVRALTVDGVAADSANYLLRE